MQHRVSCLLIVKEHLSAISLAQPHSPNPHHSYRKAV